MKTNQPPTRRAHPPARAPAIEAHPILETPLTAITAAEAHPPSPPAQADVERACALLNEVACLASTALRTSRPQPEPAASAEEEDAGLADRIDLMRQALSRIGWVADVAARRLGAPGAFARAEDWMLPGV